MNKIWEKNWVVGLISLVFALVIYSFVRNENNASNAAINSQLASSFNTSETLYNVPLYLGEHPDDIYVSDLKETVTVRLDGPRNILNQLTRETMMVQTEKITSEMVGQRELRLEIDGLPNEISYSISPSKVKAEVQKRKVVTMPVEVDTRELQLTNDHKIVEVITDPKQVKLVGSEKAIQAIDFVGIKIKTEQAVNESFVNSFRLQILDKEGQLLDVNTETMDIQANVNIEQNSREVPLKITAIGEDNKKFNYKYALLDQKTVVLYGSQKVLKAIEQVELVVDVSQQVKSGKAIGMLNLPSGITSASTNQVKVEIMVQPLVIESSEDAK